MKRVAPAAGAAASRPAASAAAKARDNQVMMGKDGTAARLSAREGNTVVPTRSRMGSCGRWGDLVAERKASDLFVECLETEGVKYVFGIPGEETLDLNESLDGSSIAFVPVRHEQGGAYMADMYGRLTQRAGVCLGTLGPGATNLVTGVADAFLDHAPLVALTGQADLERMHKESHQHIDVVSMLRPVTKWNARLSASQIIPEVVRKAFKVAQAQKPGATHIELPEDVMGEQVTGEPLPAPLRSSRVEPSDRELLRAAEVIRAAANPIVLAGNGVARNRAAPALREFARTTGIGVAETFMGKGALDYEDPHALGTVGLQSRDYGLAGFDEADVVITVGYDLVEHAPDNWNPSADKTIVAIDTTPSEVDAHYLTEVELVGDLYHVLSRLTEELRDLRHAHVGSRLDDIVLGRFEAGRHDDAFPMQPPRALWEIRQALGRRDMLISDVGLHKLWIARMFPAHEPDTVFIANGLAGMGIALPTAIAAKLVHPDRKVRDRQRRRRVPDERAGAGDRHAAAHRDRQRDLGEPPVRLDRVEAGQEVRPPLRHGLHEPRLRQARRRVRHAGVAHRGGRRLRPDPSPRAVPRRPVADRPPDRLLAGRRHL